MKTKILSLGVATNELVTHVTEFLLTSTTDARGINFQVIDCNPDCVCAVAYKKDTFIIVMQNNVEDEALLYGNWEEALTYIKRVLTSHAKEKDACQVMLSEYYHPNNMV